MSTTSTTDPSEYVQENKDTLVDIIKHSNDTFVRGLCVAALLEYGEDADVETVKQEIESFAATEGDE